MLHDHVNCESDTVNIFKNVCAFSESVGHFDKLAFAKLSVLSLC